MKDSIVGVRVESEGKEQTEEILSKLGILVLVHITALYKQTILMEGIPF